MKTMLQPIVDRALEAARSFHEDERGAEGLEKLLIIAAIVLPLLALLIVFRGQITEWVTSKWTEVESDAKTYDPDGNLP